jgi:hypothetical protein
MKNFVVFVLGLVSASCSGGSGGVSANRPSAVFGAFDTAVASVGSNLVSSLGTSSMLMRGPQLIKSAAISELCDENGQPLDGASVMNESDERYPARVFLCKIGYNSGSPDTIQGSYATLSDISCLLEQEGIVYDGQQKTITVNVVDSGCFEDTSEMPAEFEITVKATSPAEFNPNFSNGVELTIGVFGTFKMAFTITGPNEFEFMAYEDQSSITPNKDGAYVGKFDGPNGKIWFEARHDRYNCSEDNSCGWSRHDRIYVECNSVSGGACSGIKAISAAASEVYAAGLNGRISTMQGELASGIKARQFSAQSLSGITAAADFNDPTKWTEDTNSKCYTASSDSGDCSGVTGVGLPSGLFTFPLASGHTSNASWHTTLGNLSFTSVTMDADVP